MYEIITVPIDTGVTTLVAVAIVATVVLSLVHVPPVVASLKALVAPAQTLVGPVMATGDVLTVIAAVFVVVPQAFVTV